VILPYGAAVPSDQAESFSPFAKDVIGKCAAVNSSIADQEATSGMDVQYPASEAPVASASAKAQQRSPSHVPQNRIPELQ